MYKQMLINNVFNGMMYINFSENEKLYKSPQKNGNSTDENSSNQSSERSICDSSEKKMTKFCLTNDLIERLDCISPFKSDIFLNQARDTPHKNEKNYLLENYLFKNECDKEKFKEEPQLQKVAKKLNFSNEPEIGKLKIKKDNFDHNSLFNVKISKKNKKNFYERPGDWDCYMCKNRNFGFRIACNRCHCLKSESDKQLEAISNNLLAMLSEN